MLSKVTSNSSFRREILMEALQDIKVKYQTLSNNAELPYEKFMYHDLTRYVDLMIDDLVSGIVS